MQKRLDSGWMAGALVLALAGCTDDPAPAPRDGRAGSGGSTAAVAGSMSAGGAGGAGAAAGRATAMIAPFGTGTVTGTATFTQTGTDVSLTINLASCPDGMHPVHIHQGTSCADMTMQGAHWGGDGPPTTRGEGIPAVPCTGGTGTVSMTRKASEGPNLAWTIGGAVDTNIVNHVMVVHTSAEDKSRIGCGQIK